ncbi:hypothetical protein ACET52_01090 [Aeromonas veronii]
MNNIKVKKPIIFEDGFTFEWESEFEIEIFRRQSITFRYRDITSLSEASINSIYSAFLAVFIRLLSQLKAERFKINLSDDIDTDIISCWINYTRAENITFNNHKDNPNYFKKFSDTRSKFNGFDLRDNCKKIGVLFGGGKDSLSSVLTLKEVCKDSDISLISFNYWHSHVTNRFIRREQYSINPLRQKTSLSLQYVDIDYRCCLKNQKYDNTFLERYISSLGIFVECLNLDLLTYSFEFTHYHRLDGNRVYYGSSLPEEIDAISHLYQNLTGRLVNITNNSYFISERSAFKIISAKFPNYLENIFMCEATTDTKVKWCAKCKKCFEYCIYCLENGHRPLEIDFESLLLSDFGTTLINEINKQPKNIHSEPNKKWLPNLGSHLHYESMCSVIYNINTNLVNSICSTEEGLSRWKTIKQSYGNINFKITEEFIEPAFEKTSLPRKEQYLRFISSIMKKSKHKIFTMNVGNTVKKYDFT